jgi:hypothetical protein
MAQHRYSLICQEVRTDANNNLVLSGVLDEIHLAGIRPEKVDGGQAGVLLDLNVVSVWHRDVWGEPEDLEMRLVYLDPSNQQFGATDPLPVNVREYPVVRVVAKLPGLPLRGYGVYRFRVERRRPAGEWAHAGGDITVGIWPAPANDSGQSVSSPRANIG